MSEQRESRQWSINEANIEVEHAVRLLGSYRNGELITQVRWSLEKERWETAKVLSALSFLVSLARRQDGDVVKKLTDEVARLTRILQALRGEP